MISKVLFPLIFFAISILIRQEIKQIRGKCYDVECSYLFQIPFQTSGINSLEDQWHFPDRSSSEAC